MNNVNLLPMAGINNVSKDEALQVRGDAPRIYLREALNVDISPNGMPRMRDGCVLQSVGSTFTHWSPRVAKTSPCNGLCQRFASGVLVTLRSPSRMRGLPLGEISTFTASRR